jgi:hypothetical protein
LGKEIEYKIHIEKTYKLIVDSHHQPTHFYHLLSESTREHGLETLINYYEIDLSKLTSKSSLDSLKPKHIINFEVFTKQTDILLENSTIMTSSNENDNEQPNAYLILFFNSILTYVNLRTGMIIFKKGKLCF